MSNNIQVGASSPAEYPKGVTPVVEHSPPETPGKATDGAKFIHTFEKFVKEQAPEGLKFVAKGLMKIVTAPPAFLLMSLGLYGDIGGNVLKLFSFLGQATGAMMASKLGMNKALGAKAGEIGALIGAAPITIPAAIIWAVGTCANLAGSAHMRANVFETMNLRAFTDHVIRGKSPEKIYADYVRDTLKKDFNIAAEDFNAKLDYKFRGQEAFKNYVGIDHAQNLQKFREKILHEFAEDPLNNKLNLTFLIGGANEEFKIDSAKFFTNYILEKLYAEPLNQDTEVTNSRYRISGMNIGNPIVNEINSLISLRKNLKEENTQSDKTPLAIATELNQKFNQPLSGNKEIVAKANQILSVGKEIRESYPETDVEQIIPIAKVYINDENLIRHIFSESPQIKLYHIPLDQSDALIKNLSDPRFEKEIKLFKKIKDSFPDQQDKSMSEIMDSRLRGLTTEDIKKEVVLYGGNENLAKMKMVNRSLFYEKTGLDQGVSPSLQKRMDSIGIKEFSIIKAIEKEFKKSILENPATSHKKTLQDHKISYVFDSKTKELIIDTKELGKGTFKTANLSIDYFKSSENQTRYVHYTPILEIPIAIPSNKREIVTEMMKGGHEEDGEAVKVKEVENAAIPEFMKSFAADLEAKLDINYRTLERLQKDIISASGTQKDEIQKLITQLELNDEKRTAFKPTDRDRWERERSMLERVKGVEGFLQLHKIVDINGEQEIYVEIAGYEIPANITKGNLSKDERLVRDLEQMSDLYSNGKLTADGNLQMMIILGQGFKALERAHELQLLHRDLKPANILIDPQGNGILSDLGGMSEINGDPAKSESLGTTPLYASPEVSLFSDDARWDLIDEKSDVWSAGMTLQDILFGLGDHPAFKGVNTEKAPVEAIQKHIAGLGPPGSDKGIAYEKRYKEPKKPYEHPFEHLIWASTQIDPNKRISMKQFNEEYDAIIKGFQQKK